MRIISNTGCFFTVVLLIAAAAGSATATAANLNRASAERIALVKVPGGHIDEAELKEERGVLVWAFNVATPGSADITEVLINANSGRIVKIEGGFHPPAVLTDGQWPEFLKHEVIYQSQTNSIAKEAPRLREKEKLGIDTANARVRRRIEKMRADGGYRASLEKEEAHVRELLKTAVGERRTDFLRLAADLQRRIDHVKWGLSGYDPEIIEVDDHNGNWRPESGSPLSPLPLGGYVAIWGWNFGNTPGDVKLQMTSPPTQIPVVQNWQDYWANDLIVRIIPYEIQGYVDQPCQLIVTRADGHSVAIDAEFVAIRDHKLMFWPGMKLKCSHTTDDDRCASALFCDRNQGEYYIGSTFVGWHYSACCFNGVDGTDHILVNLKNGWTIEQIVLQWMGDAFDGGGRIVVNAWPGWGETLFTKDKTTLWTDGQNSDFAHRFNLPYNTWTIATLLPPAPTSSVDFPIRWHVDAFESVILYGGWIYITGPRGLEAADPPAPLPAAWPGQPCK